MIPDYQTLMLPVLQACADKEVSTHEVVDSLAQQFQLSQEEREELPPSQSQPTFKNRIAWAKTYLKQAGLVSYPARARFVITELGKQVLAKNPEHINIQFLSQFESFQDFRSRSKTNAGESSDNNLTLSEDSTPDEVLNNAYETINNALAKELLQRVRDADPYFFENLIVKLLLAMGYGGNDQEAGRAIGKSGDDGVDGVIDQDPLGVDQVYVQAKRYAEGNNINPSAIRDFYGALSLKRAQKGIFFTTSKFSKSADETAKNLGTRIVLIDGVRLAKLMIKYDVGCECDKIIFLKKVDEEFFEESI